jgi:hypothetical protein
VISRFSSRAIIKVTLAMELYGSLRFAQIMVRAQVKPAPPA